MNAVHDVAHQKLAKLEDLLGAMGEVIVAYSGGVDSSFLLWAAHKVLGARALAVTGRSGSVASGQIEEARQLARDLGARHVVLDTEELQNPLYAQNPTNRCYHCKTELFTKLEAFARGENIPWIVEGSNMDDMHDYRPGMQAVAEHNVRSPLKEAELTKAEIRVLSKEAGLPTWDKPAMPCLASRIPYGMLVSLEKLSMIDRAEAYLRSLGFRELRVRHHDSIARIELPPGDFPKLLEGNLAAEITKRLKDYGFKYVTLDLQGFRSGSLNEGIVR
ncbi:MAG TPA: ATP-dependent sacrificial sulfur transferase LarE [Candidatus Tectomicrobia bacterium]|nr:ATP-dependent sacrificial sulfur transferase LarE [Candidatus Tectomicrobia bacterium]